MKGDEEHCIVVPKKQLFLKATVNRGFPANFIVREWRKETFFFFYARVSHSFLEHRLTVEVLIYARKDASLCVFHATNRLMHESVLVH